LLEYIKDCLAEPSTTAFSTSWRRALGPQVFREKRLKWVKKELPVAPKSGPVVVAIDSTFVHHSGENIFGVYWYYDYVKKSFCLAQRVVLSTLVTPSHLVPLGYQMYHRGFLEEQKLFLEETKPAADASQESWLEYEALVKLKEERERRTRLRFNWLLI